MLARHVWLEVYAVVAEIVAVTLFLLMLVAETLHLQRTKRLAPLAFGPAKRPRTWTVMAPALRVLAVCALGWGLTTLLLITPRSYRPEGEIQPGKEQHLVVLLDVSPSMRLEDAGPGRNQTRKARGRDVLRSFFDRIPVNQYLVSVIAVYNGAKPVVVDSKDIDVVDGILGDLPLYQAFDSGETRLLTGFEEAVEIARPWNPGSTTIVLLSDGDTVPPQGMPAMPAAVADVLIVGVGDPNQGSFISGKQSKQDAFTLRQIANRLGGTYHDGNTKHLPSDLIANIVRRGEDNQEEPWSRREYALLAIGIGAFVLALLPWFLDRFGNRYLPGIRQSLRSVFKSTEQQAA